MFAAISDPEDFKPVLDNLTEQLMTTASSPILDAGNALWLGLSGIIIAWNGLRIAFSGEGWNPWEIIRLIILLSIPKGMLDFYDTPFPGIGLTFPQIIVNQGSWLNGVIVADTGSDAWTWLQAYLKNVWTTVSDNSSRQAQLGVVQPSKSSRFLSASQTGLHPASHARRTPRHPTATHILHCPQSVILLSWSVVVLHSRLRPGCGRRLVSSARRGDSRS